MPHYPTSPKPSTSKSGLNTALIGVVIALAGWNLHQTFELSNQVVGLQASFIAAVAASQKANADLVAQQADHEARIRAIERILKSQ